MTNFHFNGDALAAIRERTGLSQTDLAVETGLGQGYISELESGDKSNPRPKTVKKIADALAIPVTALVTMIEDVAA